MPAIRRDKARRRGLYIHNPTKAPTAVSIASTSQTRIHRHHIALPTSVPPPEENTDSAVDRDFSTGAADNFTPLSDISSAPPPPCVSGIKVKSRARRYANSVSFLDRLSRS